MTEINFQLSENLLFQEIETRIVEKALFNNPIVKKFVQLRRFYYEDLAIKKHLGISVPRIKTNKTDPKLFEEAYNRMEPDEKKLFHIWQIVLPDSQIIPQKLLIESIKGFFAVLGGNSQFVSLEKEYQLASFPNDEYFNNLEALKSIKCIEAWRKSKGEGVRIAVIDTGVLQTHEDINANLARDGNKIITNVFLEGVRNPTPIDSHGHGTHIAGTIAAVGNNSIGVIGVAPSAKIVPIKVFSAATTSKSRNIANAIYFAEAQKVQIINNSWYYDGTGSPVDVEDPTEDDKALLTAVKFAISKKVICVFAAGNGDKEVSDYWVVKEPETIVVGATRETSNTKLETSNRSTNLTLAAPGESIKSIGIFDDYPLMSGTSMAAAHVSGAIALYVAAKGGARIKPKDIIKRLRDPRYSDPIADTSIGGFRLNCEKLLSSPL
jgi:subtilisin family serine protease